MALDLLGTGLYSIPETAGLVDAAQSKVRVWVEGRRDKQAPIIDNDIGRLGNKVAISFTNLMELRFVALFSAAGVRMNEIRKILQEARDTLEHPHPFATNVVFRTDGRKIVADIARRNGIADLYDLRSRNYEMRSIVMGSLKEDVVFDPRGDAVSWRPRPGSEPNVYVLPTVSFGRPVLMPSHIPVESLARAVKAEGSAGIVADLYDVPVAQVREAVRFNAAMRKAA